MSATLHTRERKTALSRKTVVLRAIGTILCSMIGCAIMAQPIYFDELFMLSDRVEGIGVGGTQKVGNTFVSWNNGVFAGQLASQQSVLIIDVEGNLLASHDVVLIDTIRAQSGNLVALDDTTFITMSYEQILTEGVPGDFVLRKMNVDGTQYWKKRYGEANRSEIPQRVIQTQDGGFLIVGQVTLETGGNGDGQVLLIKTNIDGNVEWENIFGGLQFDSGKDVVQTPDEGFLVLGWTRSFGGGQRDFYLIKTDNHGNEQWHETYGANDLETGISIISLSDGNYVLAGAQIVGGVDKGKLIKVNSTGAVIWEEEYLHPESSACEINAVLELDDGSIVGAGVADRIGEGNSGWLLKTNNEGNLLWQRKYNKNNQTDLFANVLDTEDGGFLLSGQAVNETTNSQDAWLLKVDSVGCTYPNCITGIDELGSKDVMVDVWPNPAADVLNVELVDFSASQAPLEMTVLDMSGKQILKRVQNDKQGTIDVSSWSSGMYVLKGTDDKGRAFTVKVVKE